MRKLQKIFAVSATTAMTLAMGVSAFADTTVTYHFYNASKWDKVGAWVKQSIDWKDDCLPLDKCVLKDTIDGTAPHEPIWPGATMEAEGNDWYKVTCTYTDFSKGSMMIFNNYVGDSVATDTTSDADIAKIQAAGITTDSNGKLQTPNIMIKKGSEAASDYYINYDGNGAGSLIVIGKSDMVTTTPPANYPSSAAPAADGTAAPAAEEQQLQQQEQQLQQQEQQLQQEQQQQEQQQQEQQQQEQQQQLVQELNLIQTHLRLVMQ